jgi:hypothetical protein
VRDATVYFTFQATDPDGDGVRYEIDWNQDGVVDAIEPSNFVPSGTSITETYSWSTESVYTIQARTIDDEGGRSNWTAHTITITVPGTNPVLPPAVGLTTDRELVRSGERVTVSFWVDAAYDIDCAYYSNGVTETFTHSGSNAPTSYTRQSQPLVARQVFKLVCVPDPLLLVPSAEAEAVVYVIPTVEER